MVGMKAVFCTLLAVVACVAPVSVAYAQATRTWVSGVGDDVNPCSRTAPCKTFAGAISKTAAGGEISVLDPGGYGAVTITKGMTLNGDGTLASILASGVNAIIVQAGVNDVVIIRGLSINGAGVTLGTNAIRFLSGAHLRVENTNIYGFSNNGIDMVHNGTGAGQLSMENVSLTNIGSVGVRVQATAGTPHTSLDRVRIQKASFGLDVLSGAATIANSIISEITNQGIVAEGTSTVYASNCVVHDAGTGVSAFVAGSTIRISRCDIFNNTTGVNVAAGASGDSFQNNAIFGNGNNVVGTLSGHAQQ